MGGAGTALSDNAYAPYWNPAGLGQLTRYEVSFMHSTLNGEDAYDFVSYVHPLKKRGAIGVSWLRVGVDDIPITSLPVVSRPVGPANRPEVVGTFNNTDNAFLFAHGWRLPAFRGIHLQFGGTLKLLYMSGYRSTNAIGGGADVGIIAMTNPEKSHQLLLGLQASDAFTTKLYWNTPPAIGGSYVSYRNDTAAAESWYRHDTRASYLPKHTHPGTGYLYPKSRWLWDQIRCRDTTGESC